MLLENGRVDAAIEMYKSMHKWDAAVAVAELTNYGELEHLRKSHYAWLTETGQEEAAGGVKEKEGDHMAALGLYLKGGLPGKAAALVMRVGSVQFDRGMLDTITTALSKVHPDPHASPNLNPTQANQLTHH